MNRYDQADSNPDKRPSGAAGTDGLADLTAAVWLAHIGHSVGLTTMHQGKLIEHCQGLAEVYLASAKDLCEILGGPPEKLASLNRQLKNTDIRKSAEQNALIAWRSGIQVMHRWQDCYPYRLKNISSSPSVLYYRSRDWNPAPQTAAMDFSDRHKKPFALWQANYTEDRI